MLRVIKRDTPLTEEDEDLVNFVFVAGPDLNREGRLNADALALVMDPPVAADIGQMLLTSDPCQVIPMTLTTGRNATIVAFDSDTNPEIAEAHLQCFTAGVQQHFVGYVEKQHTDNWWRTITTILAQP